MNKEGCTKNVSKRVEQGLLYKRNSCLREPKAIEILFDEIDKFNSRINVTENIRDKVNLLMQMREIIDIIGQISCYKINNYEKDYL